MSARCTVLFSDDEPLLLASLSRCAQMRGMRVITDVSSSAHELARRYRPNVVVLDVSQKIGGRELLSRLKADPETRHIPVVMLTAWCDPEDRRAFATLGAEYCELKPVGMDFFERLEELAELHALESELAAAV